MASDALPCPLSPSNGNWGDLPPSPATAYVLGWLFTRLGGTFTIGSNGTRYMGRPEPALYRLQDVPLPQLPAAAPHERFHCAKEWRGALKLVDALIHRLAPSDRDLIFDLMASIAVDDHEFMPSIEEPKRTVA